ncbi:MAG: UvrD-helicase domain-containing protein [Candidatus Dormibacteria bacterium]
MADPWEQHQVVRPTLARRTGVPLRTLDVLLRELEANWQALVPEQNVDIEPALRARFLGAWNEHRRVYGYTMLSELPNLLREALRDHTDLVGLDYDLLVVDEYQDLNPCDLEVIQRLAQGGCSILAAGDDEQSIYGFRKADPEGIRRFTNDYPGAIEYPLSLTRRCAKAIVEWARTVIEGDPRRNPNRPPLTALPAAPDGTVALLAFSGQLAEAQGVADLVGHLISKEGLQPSDILILMKGDYNAAFSAPIKDRLDRMGVPVADPDVVARALDEHKNRRSLAMLRLLAYTGDSLGWATVLALEPGIGDAVFDYLYERALSAGSTFGDAVLSTWSAGFPDAPQGSGRRAADLVEQAMAWLSTQSLPDEMPEEGWGAWMLSTLPTGGVFAGFSDELAEILRELDVRVEIDTDFPRFLGQIQPLGTDIALARAGGVRLMSMSKSKGLTVEATIIVACEEGLIPRNNPDPSGEERRLLYVAMTRARRFLFCTWARRRTGPTARAGVAKVLERRNVSSYLRGGPVTVRDGRSYVNELSNPPNK